MSGLGSLFSYRRAVATRGASAAHDTPREREGLEARCRREVEWFFGTLGGRVPEEGEGPPDARARKAATAIGGWLAALLTFHRGALELRYTPRHWPPWLEAHYGAWTGLVVRLECALHPSDGLRTDDELERASVERLRHELACNEPAREIRTLKRRARTHVREAIFAYAKARGGRPCVLPPIPPRGDR